MPRRAVLIVALGALLLGACSDDGASSEATSTVTLPSGSLPSVVTTVASASTVTPTTTAVSTTTKPSTTTTPTTTKPAPSTTSAVKVPCTLERIVADTQTQYEGITPTQLRCADTWASWVGASDDVQTDGFFAVASWDGSAWELRNLGTDGICQDGGVPTDLWDRLGCVG